MRVNLSPDDVRTLLNRSGLSYREREIIKLRYGLGDGYIYTLEEVGHIFKVTRECIRRVEKCAIRKLLGQQELDKSCKLPLTLSPDID